MTRWRPAVRVGVRPPSLVHDQIAPLRRFIGSGNPLDRLESPKVDRPEPRAIPVVSEAEYKALLHTCRSSFVGRRDAAILGVLWSTGMRRTEVASIQSADVMIETSRLLVPKSKNREPRVVPLTDDAIRLLSRYLRVRKGHRHADLPDLWIGERGPLTSSAMRLMLDRRSKKAKVKVSAHQFRRALAVRWLSQNGSNRFCAPWRAGSITRWWAGTRGPRGAIWPSRRPCGSWARRTAWRPPARSRRRPEPRRPMSVVAPGCASAPLGGAELATKDRAEP